MKTYIRRWSNCLVVWRWRRKWVNVCSRVKRVSFDWIVKIETVHILTQTGFHQELRGKVTCRRTYESMKIKLYDTRVINILRVVVTKNKIDNQE